MRVAVAGDWHRNAAWALSAIDAAAEAGCKTLLQVGDLGLMWATAPEGPEAFGRLLERHLKHHGIMMYFCRGNHDRTDYLNALPFHPEGGRVVSDHIRHLDGDWVRIHNGDSSITVAGLGGATSSDRLKRQEWEREHNRPRSIYWSDEVVSRFAVRRFLEENPPSPVDIFISHEGPIESYRSGKLAFRKTTDPFYRLSAKADAIEVDLARRILWPKAHFFGHHHQRLSLWDGQSDHLEMLECLAADGSTLGNIVIYDSVAERVTGLAVEPVRWNGYGMEAMDD